MCKVFPSVAAASNLSLVQLGELERIWRFIRETHLAKRYALPYQPTSGKEWKSVVIRGIAYVNHQQYT